MHARGHKSYIHVTSFQVGECGWLDNKYRLYTEANGSMGFIIPEDFMTSGGIINTVDPIG